MNAMTEKIPFDTSKGIRIDELFEMRFTPEGRAWLESHGWAGLAVGNEVPVQLRLWQMLEVFGELIQPEQLARFVEGGVIVPLRLLEADEPDMLDALDALARQSVKLARQTNAAEIRSVVTLDGFIVRLQANELGASPSESWETFDIEEADAVNEGLPTWTVVNDEIEDEDEAIARARRYSEQNLVRVLRRRTEVISEMGEHRGKRIAE